MSDPSSVPTGPRPGDLIAGKYRLERLLGEGGMGAVYAASHTQLREPVALKFLRAAAARSPDLVERFKREARAAVRIKSEHVARVLDVGTLPTGEPFMVMEMLAGMDLHKLSAARGPLPIPEAAVFLTQVCDAVSEAHLYGIVHRDLKPANLFLTRRADGSPLVKVLDFGISKVSGEEEDQNLTATTDVLGSPLYMSPEQIRSPRDVDARADVWALGAILYKLLTGKAAFAAQTSSASLAKIVADPPPPLRAARPDAPAELEALVLRCLEKDVTRRVQSAAELARALAPYLPLNMRARAGEAMDTTGAGASLPGPGIAPDETHAQRRTGAVVVAALVTTTLAAAVALVVLFRQPGHAGAVSAAALAPTAAPASPATAAPTASTAPTASAAALPSATASASAPSPTAATSAPAAPSGAPRRPNPPRGGSSDAFSDRL
jgi:serine/threonine-protein kinase